VTWYSEMKYSTSRARSHSQNHIARAARLSKPVTAVR
jgi:hypothetical protein